MCNKDYNTKIFTKIYNNNEWKCSESVSGPSSTLLRTENIRKELPQLFKKYNIKTIIDAPCGDLNWMKHILNITDINYIGIDIVSQLIDINNHNFMSDKIKFICLDITSERLPRGDLLISRDFLFHLSYELILAFFYNFIDSNINYLLTTSHINPGFLNKNIKTGGWRYLDLKIYPFNFRNPIYKILDGGGDRYLLLYSKSQIISYLKNIPHNDF